ncbi:EEF1A lysine methyltransferase 1-like isoform X1 [Amphibalanus amphitrite]|uniref:EEF1A lysine methyltransferase 1-like isoform X1 n=2 Tax=Amphibalanus amphitrite TaxID=1232801 RepID=UPI001C9258A1|nr:EEF1A lysine methyltransferase 1-like isoform X1 [Amphibalanus amphitrite]
MECILMVSDLLNFEVMSEVNVNEAYQEGNGAKITSTSKEEIDQSEDVKEKRSPAAEDQDEEDDVQLSAFTMSALQEFVSEQLEREQRRQQAEQLAQDAAKDPDQLADFEEDWQLSQFWYDEATCRVLASEALRLAGPSGRVACLSSPTLYRHLRKVRPPELKLTLFEYDQRFSVFGPEFVLYDYRSPLDVPGDLREQFDLVVADPPFLSEECLTKTAVTVRLLAKQHILLCTGAQMAPLAGRLLGLHECRFRPAHANNLANEFRCFANYDLDSHVSKGTT